MTNIITDITISEDITLVSVYNIPNGISFIADLFAKLSQKNINIDMITQTASQGADVIVSFTAPDNDLANILSVIGTYKSTNKALRTEVNSGNFKVSLYGDEMKTTPGVAAHVFKLFEKSEIDIKLITTSEVDISCLIDRVNYEQILKMLKDEFPSALK